MLEINWVMWEPLSATHQPKTLPLAYKSSATALACNLMSAVAGWFLSHQCCNDYSQKKYGYCILVYINEDLWNKKRHLNEQGLNLCYFLQKQLIWHQQSQTQTFGRGVTRLMEVFESKDWTNILLIGSVTSLLPTGCLVGQICVLR